MKKILIALLTMLLVFPAVYAAITVEPTSWSISYNIGDTRPSKAFTIRNTDNVTRTVAISATGDVKNWINFSSTSLSIDNGTSKDVTAYANIPDTTNAGVYVAYLEASGTSVPIIITVTSSTLTCRLVPMITNYITTIKTDTSAFTKQFSVSVSKYCDEPVDIKTPLVIGVTETSDGAKPIALSGALSLGPKDPGEEAVFEINFNVKGLQPGTYSPTVIVPGYYKGDKIQTTIAFSITVTGSLAPVSTDIKPPTYEIPSQVKKGEVFEIKAINLNANLQPQLFFNQDLVGTFVERKEESWSWKGYINKTGTFSVSITSMYSGGQIGGVTTKDIVVVEDYGSSIGGGNMTFDFYPKEKDMKDGDNVSILVRNSGGNIIDGVIIYINGVRTDSKQFLFEGGKTYQITATQPNYPTLDRVLETSKKELSVSVSPFDPEEGETLLISVSDSSGGGYVGNLTMRYDNMAVMANVMAGNAGQHILEVSAPGYSTKTVQVNVSLPTIVLSAPETIKRGKAVNISISKGTSWSVRWDNQNEKKPQSNIVASGITPNIGFTPKDNGVYQVYVRGNKMVKSYEVKGFVWSWWYLIIPAAIVLIILIVKITMSGFGRRGGGGRVGYGLPSESGIVSRI